MYEALGDYEKQEAVRMQSPNGVHCELLLVNANACTNCKKNPHNTSSERSEARTLLDEEIQAIYRIAAMYDYGLLTCLDEISPAEAICLRLLDKQEKARQIQMSFGAMSGMFGGKK